jgi:hypothetical protein
MARGAAQVFTNLGRGLNTAASPYELQAGETPDCLNVRGTVRGAIRKREGLLDLSNGAGLESQPRKIAVYRQGSTTRLIAFGNRVQVLEPGGAPTVPYTSATASPWTWSSALGQQVGSQGPLFLMSDTEKVYYDGGSFNNWTATSGTIPSGRMMCAHQNRLYVADVSSIPDSRTAVVFSDIGNYRAWPVENIVKFDPFRQDRITALCSLGQYLMVFKRDGIWRVYDADTGANNKITSDTGTVFRDSVVATDQGVFFLDPDRGVMRTDGSSVSAVSDAILPELRSLPLDDEATFSVSAAYWEGSYWLSIPNAAGVPQQLLEFDLQEKVWWRHDCAAYDLQVAPFGQSSDPLLVRDALIGAVPGSVLSRLGVAPPTTYRLFQVMRPNTSQDVVQGIAPRPITFRWLSAPATLDGNSHMSKRLAGLRVDSIGPGSVAQRRDFSSAPEVLGALDGTGGTESGAWAVPRPGTWGVPAGREAYVWGGAGSIVESRFHSLGVAREWQLELRGLSASKFEAHSYALSIGPRPRRD